MRRTARRTSRRTVRRMTPAAPPAPAAPGMPAAPAAAPVSYILLAGEGGAPPVKLTDSDAQRIQAQSGMPPDQLEDADLRTDMQELGIRSQPLTAEDQQALGLPVTAPATMAPTTTVVRNPPPAAPPPPPPGGAPTNEQLTQQFEQLASLRDRGMISPQDYDAKKKQLLGL
jgi:Short C-terminal domain